MTSQNSTYQKLTLCEQLRNDLRYASKSYRKKLAMYNREAAIRLNYEHIRKVKLNLDDPTDLPEAIQWLKLYSDTSQWGPLADKIAVREYVTACGLSEHLNELYAVYDRTEDIDWNKLPKSFVLKLNNGCHSVLIIENQDIADKQSIVSQFNRWMKEPFGYESAEFHYLSIKPKILIEKYLHQDANLSDSLIDYKIYCVGGKAQAILTCHNRTAKHAIKAIYDLDWHIMPSYNSRAIPDGEKLPKPESLSAMIAAAETLSKPFPFVRVDYYEIEGKPIFGEMTFTPASGYHIYGSTQFLTDMGQSVMKTLSL